jgi:positive regulator of sigma E activity
VPGALKSMLEGQMLPIGPTTQSLLVATSLMMAIPSALIFLTVVLRAGVARVLNIAFGVVYTAIILVTMWGWIFFRIYGVVEITLSLLVVWYAWRWPRAAPSVPSSV